MQLELFRLNLQKSCEDAIIQLRVTIDRPNPKNLRRLTRKARTANQALHSLRRAEVKANV